MLVILDGKPIKLTRIPFQVCATLARRPGVTREYYDIIRATAMRPSASPATVYSAVKRARMAGVDRIEAVYGVGYRWQA
jgi:DNA-binding response OmpR family regulator